ncbi:MAG TPA: class I SAM-dependent methyltransferase [Gaiellaceae bacterium]|nr:class I SAM-dependent methyltransferase [Gaiellaceae bacterium]
MPETWHHGLVARWWAENNLEGPEIEYFRPFVVAGQPALDAGCGAGRLLIPYLRAGLDVDGADVSADMLDRCRERAEREGLPEPGLYAQALHELDLPRRYRTILVCGAFGLGSTRTEDAEALRRLYAHLEPGGTLVLDNEVPWSVGHWDVWANRADLPRPWREEGNRSGDLELRTRLVDLDPHEQRVTLGMRAARWEDGRRVEEEEHELTMTLYFTHELELMLERAGFVDVGVRAGYRNEPATGDDAFVVFVARRL